MRLEPYKVRSTQHISMFQAALRYTEVWVSDALVLVGGCVVLQDEDANPERAAAAGPQPRTQRERAPGELRLPLLPRAMGGQERTEAR
jgi:hypothetical protein